MRPTPVYDLDLIETQMSDTEHTGQVPPRKRTKVSRACDEVSISEMEFAENSE